LAGEQGGDADRGEERGARGGQELGMDAVDECGAAWVPIGPPVWMAMAKDC
jgi:hypothetical protein